MILPKESATFSSCRFNFFRLSLIPNSRYDVDDFDGQNNFRLFEFTINLDATKKFQKVGFQHSTNRTYPTILALAKEEKTSGIDSIESDGDKTIEAVYNIQGIQVKNPASGLYIVRYSDGSTRKVVIK